TLKHAISQTIVDFAIEQTDCHLIICNSNRNRNGRLDLLTFFQHHGFATILVHFDIPDEILQLRVAETKRSTSVFRIAATFEEVLARQNAASAEDGVAAPIEDEADHLFVVKKADDVQNVSREIVALSANVAMRTRQERDET